MHTSNTSKVKKNKIINMRTVISLVTEFTISFGFKEGLIPSFLYLFNVKADTVKMLLNPDKNIRKSMKNE